MHPRLLLASVAAAAGLTLFLGFTELGLSSCSLKKHHDDDTPPSADFDIGKINHVVVIYQENWSFDGLYSQFPGANGLAFGTAVSQTRINDNTAITAIPQPIDGSGSALDNANFPGFSASTPMATFNLGAAPYTLSTRTLTGDIVHRFYIEQWQINGGLNDRFLAWSDNPGLVLSGFDATSLPEGKLAQDFTMCDNTYHSAFGGSFLNHIFLIAAQAPVYGATNAPITAATLKGYPGFLTFTDPLPTPGISPSYATLVADTTTPIPGSGNDWPTVLSPGKARKQDAQLLNDADAADPALGNGSYYAVNTIQPPYWPFSKSGPFLPPQTMPTIGDRLTAAGQSWKWYSGGWNQAVAGNPDANFQFHHQAFNFFKNYAPGAPGRVHLADTEDLANDLATDTLPAVSFVKFIGSNNEHPGYADLLTGQQAVADLVQKIQNSSAWKDTAIFITYDEHGGRYDHVAPPTIDKWGPGVRVPMIVISPYAKRGFVDHTQYETVSILKFIEKRWSLSPLTGRDAAANDLTNAFTGIPSVAN